jgi:hypothetical protein
VPALCGRSKAVGECLRKAGGSWGELVTKRRGSGRSTPLERLALYRAKPVNRDALNAVDYKAAQDKPNAEEKLTPIRAKPLLGKPKVSIFTAADEAERKARIRRVFGFKVPGDRN